VTQFGAGPQLAAQCPRAPALIGLRPWTDADGPVPVPLATRATVLAADTTVPLGATESFPLPGVTALIRVEARAWLRGADGSLAEGCFRVGGVYLPAENEEAIVRPPILVNESPWAKAAAILTVVTVGAGIIAGLTSWISKRG
jgi:hypothetical protein